MEQAAAGPFTAGTLAVPKAGWRMEQGAASPFTAGQHKRAQESLGELTRGTSAKQYSHGVDALESILRMRSKKQINR